MRVTSFLVAAGIENREVEGKGRVFSLHSIVGGLSRPGPGLWEFPIFVEIEGDHGQHGLPMHLDIEIEDPAGTVYGVEWEGFMGMRPHPDAKPVLLFSTMARVPVEVEGLYKFRFSSRGEFIGDREFPLTFGPVDPSM